jgi:hypothetical protein
MFVARERNKAFAPAERHRTCARKATSVLGTRRPADATGPQASLPATSRFSATSNVACLRSRELFVLRTHAGKDACGPFAFLSLFRKIKTNTILPLRLPATIFATHLEFHFLQPLEQRIGLDPKRRFSPCLCNTLNSLKIEGSFSPAHIRSFSSC